MNQEDPEDLLNILFVDQNSKQINSFVKKNCIIINPKSITDIMINLENKFNEEKVISYYFFFL